MKFDNLGLPQVNGASDLQDSAALAGIMTVFEWPQKVWCEKYVVFPGVRTFGYEYRRHPTEYQYNFSRDQYVCLIAGLSKEKNNQLVGQEYVSGKDWMSPSVKGHEARCKGLKSNWFQDLWFWADLYFSAKFKPLEELNQLFCMMMIADSKFIRWYCNANPHWPQAIKNYWCENDGSWRNEPELAALMIEKINSTL